MAREVLVIAHRGANEVAPENTVAAFAAAAEMGADYVEVDIRTTLDGKLVCMHDRAVDRTTDGAGLVSDLTFDGVRSLDAGSWFDSSFARTQVPTADEVFEALKGRCGIYVDAKDVSADDVAALVRRHDAVASTIVYGNLDFHSALREIAPEIHASTWYRHDNLDRIVAAADPDWFGFSYRALSNRRGQSRIAWVPMRS